MDPEDLSPALDGQVSGGDIRHHGFAHHGETLSDHQRLRDPDILDHREGLLPEDSPLHLHGNLLFAIDIVGKSGRGEPEFFTSDSLELIFLNISKRSSLRHPIDVQFIIPGVAEGLVNSPQRTIYVHIKCVLHILENKQSLDAREDFNKRGTDPRVLIPKTDKIIDLHPVFKLQRLGHIDFSELAHFAGLGWRET